MRWINIDDFTTSQINHLICITRHDIQLTYCGRGCVSILPFPRIISLLQLFFFFLYFAHDNSVWIVSIAPQIVFLVCYHCRIIHAQFCQYLPCPLSFSLFLFLFLSLKSNGPMHLIITTRRKKNCAKMSRCKLCTRHTTNRFSVKLIIKSKGPNSFFFFIFFFIFQSVFGTRQMQGKKHCLHSKLSENQTTQKWHLFVAIVDLVAGRCASQTKRERGTLAYRVIPKFARVQCAFNCPANGPCNGYSYV